MTINEIYIKNFGRLSNFKLTAHEGVNIIYGPNEAGKTTIMAFIRAMLYGAGRAESRRKYEPWDGGKMGGTMVFECGGKHYSLSRQFGTTKSLDKIELWCKTTGEQVDLPEKVEPGEHLMGINEMSFVNSVFIGQINPAISGSNDEILKKLMNLASAGDETASRTEIEGRLNDAASKLSSKRAGAIIPALEAEQSELLSKRSEIVEQFKQADALRESVKELEDTHERLSREYNDLIELRDNVKKAVRLNELDEIITTKQSVEADEARYQKLHEAMYGSELSFDDDFVSKSRELLENIRSEEKIITLKKEQLAECNENLESVDRSRVGLWTAISNNQQRIDDVLMEYDKLLDARYDAERRLEDYETEISNSQMSPKNIAIILGLLALGFFFLGFVHWIFFLFAFLVAGGFAAYYILKEKGIIPSPTSGIENEIQEIDDDIRELSRSNRKLLDELDVPHIQAMRDEVAEMERVSTLTQTEVGRRKKLKSEIEELAAKCTAMKQELRDSLSSYTRIDTDAQAVAIISTLDKKQREHAVLEQKLQSSKEALEKMLDGTDYDLVVLEAQELEEELGGKRKLTGTELDEIEKRTDDTSAKLMEVGTELARKQAELSGCSMNIQDIEEYNDKIKLLISKTDKYKFELDAINIAIEALGEAFETMQRDFGPILNFKAGRILNELTGGKYPSVFISERLVPSVTEGPNSSNIRNCTSLSLGTNDQVYLALRLAIAGILSDVQLPVFLDDAFAQYDDKRVQEAMFYLAKESGGKELGQVIIFTCHSSIVKAAKEMGLQNPVIKITE